MALSRSLQYRAFSKAITDEKSFPLFPVGGWGGAVVTNDWCINAVSIVSRIQKLLLYSLFSKIVLGLCSFQNYRPLFPCSLELNNGLSESQNP